MSHRTVNGCASLRSLANSVVSDHVNYIQILVQCLFPGFPDVRVSLGTGVGSTSGTSTSDFSVQPSGDVLFQHFLASASSNLLVCGFVLPINIFLGFSSFFFFFSDNAHSSELSNVVHDRCASSAGSKR